VPILIGVTDIDGFVRIELYASRPLNLQEEALDSVIDIADGFGIYLLLLLSSVVGNESIALDSAWGRRHPIRYSSGSNHPLH